MDLMEQIHANLTKTLADLGEFIETKAKPKWPSVGDVYYTPDFIRNGAASFKWSDDSFDMLHQKQGLVFETVKECEYHIKMFNLAHEIMAQGRDFKVGEGNYYLCFYHNEQKIGVICSITIQSARTPFETEAKAKAAVDGVSNEDFLYMLNRGMI